MSASALQGPQCSSTSERTNTLVLFWNSYDATKPINRYNIVWFEKENSIWNITSQYKITVITLEMNFPLLYKTLVYEQLTRYIFLTFNKAKFLRNELPPSDHCNTETNWNRFQNHAIKFSQTKDTNQMKTNRIGKDRKPPYQSLSYTSTTKTIISSMEPKLYSWISLLLSSSTTKNITKSPTLMLYLVHW